MRGMKKPRRRANVGGATESRLEVQISGGFVGMVAFKAEPIRCRVSYKCRQVGGRPRRRDAASPQSLMRARAIDLSQQHSVYAAFADVHAQQ